MSLKPNPSLLLRSIILQRAPSCIQKRTVFLMHNALSRATVGVHKSSPFVQLRMPDFLPDKQLLIKGVPDKIFTFKEVKREMRPGKLLFRAPPSREEVKYRKAPLKAYTFFDLEKTNKIFEFNKSMKGRNANLFPLTTVMTPERFYYQCQRMFFAMKALRAVEVHLKPVAGKKYATVAWTLENQLHLLPDSILSAMPEGSRYSITPTSNGDYYCWVMAAPGCPRYGSYTERLEEKRAMHYAPKSPKNGVPFGQIKKFLAEDGDYKITGTLNSRIRREISNALEGDEGHGDELLDEELRDVEDFQPEDVSPDSVRDFNFPISKAPKPTPGADGWKEEEVPKQD